MSDCTFKIKNDLLTCEIIHNSETIILSEAQAVKLLKTIDEVKNNKIYTQGNNIIIQNKKEKYNIIIKDIVRFTNSTYCQFLNNSIKCINKNVEKMQIEKHKRKKGIKNIIPKVIGASTPIVIAMLISTSLSLDDTKEIKYEDIAIETQNNNNYENTNDIIFENEKTDEEEITTIKLDIEDRSMNEDIIDIQEKYIEQCNKAGKRWGISPNILLGLLTQESHGLDKNLTQITFSAFEDQVLNVYNFEKNDWMKIVITSKPEKYNDVDMTINKEELNNPYTNIAVSAILLNNSINVLDTNNIFAILEYYNKGHGNFYKNMNVLETNLNKTATEILENPIDTDLINYSYVCNQGDENYICNVMQYIPNSENGGIYFYRIKDGNKMLIKINVEKSLSKNVVKN